MSTLITLPFLDEFTSLDTELWEVALVGGASVDVTGGYLRIRDLTSGGSTGSGAAHIPFAAFEDQDIFNRTLMIETRLEFISVATACLGDLMLGDGTVGRFRRWGDASLTLDTIIRSSENNQAATNRATGVAVPLWLRAIWNGSRKHIRYGVGGRWIEPGRLAFFFSPDGVTYQLRMIQRPGFDLRPNEAHGQTRAVGVIGSNYGGAFSAFETRWSWFKLQELVVGDGIISEDADTSKKAWYMAHTSGGSQQKASEDGGANWTALGGSSNSILGGNRHAMWTGDMQGANITQPFGTGNRNLYLQDRAGQVYVKTLGGGAGAYAGGAIWAGDGQQNLFSRNRIGLLAFAATDAGGLLRVEYNLFGFYGSWQTITGALSSGNIGSIWWFSPTLFYVVGANNTGSACIWRYNGSWTRVVGPIGGTAAFTGIHAFDENRICSVTPNSSFGYEWDGVSWTQRNLPNPAWRANDIWGVKEADGNEWWYIILNDGSSNMFALRKQPGDASWSSYGPTQTGVTPLHIHAFGDGTLLATEAGPRLYSLASPGAGSWVLEDTATGFSIDSLHGTVVGDYIPPYLDNQNPIPDGTGDDSVIVLEVLDSGVGVDSTRVEIALDPDGLGAKTTVWLNETEQNGATVTITAIDDGYRYTIQPPLGLRANIRQYVYIVAYDNNENLLDTFYSFLTGEPPVISNESPSPGSSNVDNNAAIFFRVTDDFAVLPEGVNVYIKREGHLDFTKIFDGATLTFAAGWSGSYEANDENGYDFTITPWPPHTYQSLETITVKVEADD